ncbi:MAG: DUF502 domain-containing protein [Gemmatimonadetes bacterium]|nr:DUF502 domain-containing protein [Gemmatimonadota bacterium]NIO31938.1 DUF502 domain-containing protein [Gemmatimonadota bacterium]
MKRLMASVRAKLLAGIVVTVPVVATILALRFLLRNLDDLLGPWIGALIGRSVPGLGLVATFVLVLLAGIVATNLAGRRLIALVERAFTGLPLVRRLYGASKDIVESATLSQRHLLREVVMLEHVVGAEVQTRSGHPLSAFRQRLANARTALLIRRPLEERPGDRGIQVRTELGLGASRAALIEEHQVAMAYWYYQRRPPRCATR